MSASQMEHRDKAIRIQEMAGGLRSIEEAGELVALIEQMFSAELPGVWKTRSFRQRLAQAEYTSATDRTQLISEQRIADAWNEFAARIGASPDVFVTAAEFHHLRDSHHLASRFFWARGSQSIWTVSTLYATTPDGNLAEGCRTLEAIRLLWDIANFFGNLQAMRRQLQAGTSTSDWLRQALDMPATGTKCALTYRLITTPDPATAALRQYSRNHGRRKLQNAIASMIDALLSNRPEDRTPKNSMWFKLFRAFPLKGNR